MVHTSFEVTDSSTDLYEFLELVNFTVSPLFKEKWKYKYSSSFIEEFQKKIVEAFEKKKPVKLSQLTGFLTKTCGYSATQVKDFFESIEIDLYFPLVA
jgi:hypothetical protein